MVLDSARREVGRPAVDDGERAQPTVALLPWGNVIEDFLDPLGISLETFCHEFRGSWIFGYVDALQDAGVRTVIIAMSNRVAAPRRLKHEPSGATLCLLPVPRIYRALRRRMVYPYGQSVRYVFGQVHGGWRALLPLLGLLREVAPYLATPPRVLARELRRERCDAILCQEYEFPRFDVCVLLGRLLGLPVFATFQGGTYHHCHVERFLRPWSVRGCRGLIVAPRTETERVCARYSLAPAKVARIFNPIDVNVWTPSDQREAREAVGLSTAARVVAWHGRLDLHKKGIDILLDAWDLLCGERPDQDLQLLLVGTGSDAEALRSRVAAGRSRGVRWIDAFIHDAAALRRYLAAADVYAFTSRYEGFPVAPLEAMACGLPVVATAADGIPDILDGGEASGGLMVPRDDAPALAEALGRVLDDAEWGHELGRRARQRVETGFASQAIGAQLRACLFASPPAAGEMAGQPLSLDRVGGAGSWTR